MIILYVFIAMAALFGSALTLHTSTAAVVGSSQGAPEPLADNFFAYADTVLRYTAAQPDGFTAPGGSNTVPDSALDWPFWYERNPRWTNKVINGRATIYAKTQIPGVDFSDVLAARSDGAYGAGITASNREIISPLYGRTGVYAPPGVPAGVH